MRVYVFTFQPFPSRRGIDHLIGLKFSYDARLVELLKQALRSAAAQTGRGQLGGWLPQEKAWFLERLAWAHVRRELEQAGCTFDVGAGVDDEPPRHEEHREAGRSAPPVDWSGMIAKWYRGLALDYHPDRNGGDATPMKVINDAHGRLKKLVGV